VNEQSELVQDITQALALREKHFPGLGWTLGVITNPQHMLAPYGSGVCVTLHGSKGEVVFEKGSSFVAAMAVAIDRLNRRIAGEAGA
jgi:hypothetical protein